MQSLFQIEIIYKPAKDETIVFSRSIPIPQKGSAPLFRTSPHLMKKKAMCACIVLLLICSFLLCSCSVSNRVLIRYYSEKSNYVTASGVVSHIKDAPERDHLVFGFSELSPSMDDVSFCKGASCKKFSWERRSVS